MTTERGRIHVVGFSSEEVTERESISEWTQDISATNRSRTARAWLRFKRNRSALFGLVTIVLMGMLALFARPIEMFGIVVQPISLAPYDPGQIGLLHGIEAHQSPSADHLFGTDRQGRDLFSRVIFGGRWSLSIGFIAVGLALFVGIPLGAIAGYYGGWIDEAIMRIVDILYAFPFLVLALTVVAIIGRGYWEMVLALTIVGWIAYARLIRGEILRVKENEYVLAAKALGAKNGSIMFRHIVPNAMAPVIVQATLNVGTIVLAVASLGFLGLGLDPEAAEWGTILQATRETIIQGPGGTIPWWVTVFPGGAIFLFVLAINLIGDGIRDAFDPQGETSTERRGGGL